MANEEYVTLLKQGVDGWNAWRLKNHDIHPDLREADLHEANLYRADLARANLAGANLATANLIEANLTGVSIPRGIQ
jgi:uncharacterized protein YjbI with pentapeptide repeats